MIHVHERLRQNYEIMFSEHLFIIIYLFYGHTFVLHCYFQFLFLVCKHIDHNHQTLISLRLELEIEVHFLLYLQPQGLAPCH